MIFIVHQCGAQLRLSLNDKKCGSKGGKKKLTNKEKFPTILTCNEIISNETVAAHLLAAIYSAP